MGAYNILHAELSCPRCREMVTTEIECFFGNTAPMLKLRIGDKYPWVPRRQPQNGGRPEGRRVTGEGYMDCPACGKDSFLRVVIEDEVIDGIEPDPTRKGYVAD